MNKSEQESVVAVALLAAFADGQKDEAEHAAIRRVAEGFQMQLVDMASLYQRIITKQLTLQQAVAGLTSAESKSLAYEVARCICEADRVMMPAEQAFLTELTACIGPQSKLHSVAGGSADNRGTTLASDSATSQTPQTNSEESLDSGAIADPTQPLDPVLIRYSVLTAALELLPQTAGALAILPVQLKMVYDISRRHGVQIDHQSVKDFGAALGIGAAGQILETGLRRLMSAVVGTVTGSTVGNLSSGVAGTAMTFATTYALGTVADQYYAAGRKIELPVLKAEFSQLIEKAKQTQAQYSNQITDKSKQLVEQLQSSDLTSVLGGLLQGKF